MNILSKVTARALRKNKTRTWVTIIGILLSAAMFTAVTTCVSSVQNYLLRTVVANSGGWHGMQTGATAAELETLRQAEGLRDLTALEAIGYADIGSGNSHKPYLMVAGIDENAEKILSIRITEGRMPENLNEILIPNHLDTNGGVKISLNEVLTLGIGDRMEDGWKKTQQNPWENTESLVVREEQTYTVVGFYDRLAYEIEPYTAPGYTALTVSETEAPARSDVYIRMKNPNDIYALLEDVKTAQYNTDLLRYTGMSNEGSYNQVLYGMASILMGIILFGSVALIYNAFSISVSERTKQFGVLKTIGATKRQIRQSVYFEALTLSAVGIPLGILSGILGIAITLQCTGGMFDMILDNGVELKLYVSAGAVAVAALVALLTVLISAWVPAHRAMRQNPIDAVRQTGDISIKARKVRSPRWVYKLFGFEGMLADKNFKRNRKKYRTTVFSLFVSVVLFVSASSFCAYLIDATDTATNVGDYDLSYSFYTNAESELTAEEFGGYLDRLQTVEEYLYLDQRYQYLKVAEEDLTPEFKEHREQGMETVQVYDGKGEQYGDDELRARIYFFDDDTFYRWAEEQGLSVKDYSDPANPKAVAVNNTVQWNGEQYSTVPVLAHQQTTASIHHIPDYLGEYMLYDAEEQEDGYFLYTYQNEAGQQLVYDERDPIFEKTLTVSGWAEESPLGSTSSNLMLIYPMGMKDAVYGESKYEDLQYQFKAKTNHRAAEEELRTLLSDLDLKDGTLENMRAGREAEQALVTVVNVFSYGFIILISLIALANVFNTISTNIALRRREFAMLRSVGMSERGIHRMMNYECLLYGAKGLSFGMIAAVFVTYLIHRVVNSGVITQFYIPWYSIAVAVSAVFMVVFATMLYSMRKIKGEDPISALKNENL